MELCAAHTPRVAVHAEFTVSGHLGQGCEWLCACAQRGAYEELRCVLAVIRHGDRTPKQKMKMKVTQVYHLGCLKTPLLVQTLGSLES